MHIYTYPCTTAQTHIQKHIYKYMHVKVHTNIQIKHRHMPGHLNNNLHYIFLLPLYPEENHRNSNTGGCEKKILTSTAQTSLSDKTMLISP